MEDGESPIIYYYNRQDTGTLDGDYQTWEVNDPRVKDILDAVLGVQAIVTKQRELWHKGNITFHLDVVKDVGQVFEIEAISEDGPEIEAQVADLRSRFDPYLGHHISGSNEDLVPPPA